MHMYDTFLASIWNIST